MRKFVIVVGVALLFGLIILSMSDWWRSSTAIDFLKKASSAKDMDAQVQYYMQGIASAINDLGALFFSNKEYAKAIHLFHKALAFNQNNPVFKTNLAEAYIRLGESKNNTLEAICAYQRSLDFLEDKERQQKVKNILNELSLKLREEEQKLLEEMTPEKMDKLLEITTADIGVIKAPVATISEGEKIGENRVRKYIRLGVLIPAGIIVSVVVFVVYQISKRRSKKTLFSPVNFMTQKEVEKIALQIVRHELANAERSFMLNIQKTLDMKVREIIQNEFSRTGESLPSKPESLSSSLPSPIPVNAEVQLINWWETDGAKDFQSCQESLTKRFGKNTLIKSIPGNSNNWHIIAIKLDPSVNFYYVLPRRNDLYDDFMKIWFSCGLETPRRDAIITSLKKLAKTKDLSRIEEKGVVELYKRFDLGVPKGANYEKFR